MDVFTVAPVRMLRCADRQTVRARSCDFERRFDVDCRRDGERGIRNRGVDVVDRAILAFETGAGLQPQLAAPQRHLLGNLVGKTLIPVIDKQDIIAARRGDGLWRQLKPFGGLSLEISCSLPGAAGSLP